MAWVEAARKPSASSKIGDTMMQYTASIAITPFGYWGEMKRKEKNRECAALAGRECTDLVDVCVRAVRGDEVAR